MEAKMKPDGDSVQHDRSRYATRWKQLVQPDGSNCCNLIVAIVQYGCGLKLNLNDAEKKIWTNEEPM